MTAMYAEQSTVVRPTTGREIAARRERLGLRIKDLAEHADVSRDTLSDWERGVRRPQYQTVDAVVAALERLEEEMGIDAPPASPEAGTGRVVRFEVEGVYGAKALVVEGPIEDIAELEDAVDRIMRRIQGRGEMTAEIEQQD